MLVEGQREEISEQRYYDLLDTPPPVYVSMLDGREVKHAFAVGEAYTHTDETIVCILCYEESEKFYQVLAEIRTAQDKPIKFVESGYHTRDNRAITYNTKHTEQNLVDRLRYETARLQGAKYQKNAKDIEMWSYRVMETTKLIKELKEGKSNE